MMERSMQLTTVLQDDVTVEWLWAVIGPPLATSVGFVWGRSDVASFFGKMARNEVFLGEGSFFKA